MKKSICFLSRAVLLSGVFLFLVSLSVVQAEESKAWGEAIELPEGTQIESLQTTHGTVKVPIPAGWKMENDGSHSLSFRFMETTYSHSTCKQISFQVNFVQESDRNTYKAPLTGNDWSPKPEVIDSYVFKSGDFTVQKSHYMPLPAGNKDLQTLTINMIYEPVAGNTFRFYFSANGLSKDVLLRAPIMEAIAKSIVFEPKQAE